MNAVFTLPLLLLALFSWSSTIPQLIGCSSRSGSTDKNNFMKLITSSFSDKVAGRFLLLPLLFLPLFSLGNDAKKLLQSIHSNYTDLKSCSSGMEYKIYRGFDSATPVEEYSGQFCRDGANTFRRIHQSDFINLDQEGLFLHIDHTHREMTVSHAIKEELFETDLEHSLKYCGNIASNPAGDDLVVTLYLNKTHDLPYSRIDILVDKKNWIKSITLYYAAKVNFSKDFNRPEYDRVKMKISYTDFDPSWKEHTDRFDAGRYLSVANETFVPSEQYINYSIVDLRK